MFVKKHKILIKNIKAQMIEKLGFNSFFIKNNSEKLPRRRFYDRSSRGTKKFSTDFSR